MKRIFATIIAIGLLGVLGGCSSTNAIALPTTDIAAIQTTAPLDRITVRGAVESVNSRNIYSNLGFNVESVHVEVGDVVTTGQILAALDTTDLEFAIAQLRVEIDMAQRSSHITISDSQRMFNEATANLANNTNMRILHAEAALNTANVNLTQARRDREIVLSDYEIGSNIVVLSAESAMLSARADLDVLIDSVERLQAMYDAGFLAREELRQAEAALATAQSWYNDTRTAYENAATMEVRTLEQTETMLQSATAFQANAQTLLNAERANAQQELEMLRSAVEAAEITANFEALEIALAQLERQLEDATITSPISGTVTAVIAREGAPGMGLMFVVEDTENLRIVTAFREYDIAMIHEGMEVAITADATGATVHNGIISRINPAATVGLPIVEFETEILIISADADLRIGMTARVDLEVSQ